MAGPQGHCNSGRVVYHPSSSQDWLSLRRESSLRAGTSFVLESPTVLLPETSENVD